MSRSSDAGFREPSSRGWLRDPTRACAGFSMLGLFSRLRERRLPPSNTSRFAHPRPLGRRIPVKTCGVNPGASLTVFVPFVALVFMKAIQPVFAGMDDVPPASCTNGQSGSVVNIGGSMQYWCDNWLLLFAYNHAAGASNDDSGTRSAPTSPTTSSAHFFLENIGYNTGVEKVGFYCSTTAHSFGDPHDTFGPRSSLRRAIRAPLCGARMRRGMWRGILISTCLYPQRRHLVEVLGVRQ